MPLNKNTSYVVIRKAVLMEDEGRTHLICQFDTQQEAQDWINSQVDEYFKPSDYYIMEIASARN